MVPKHRRHESDLDAYDKIRNLRAECCKWIVQTKRLEEIPENIKNKIFEDIYRNLSLATENIVRANSIFPVIEKEVDQRRLIQNVAISYCYAFSHNLMFICDLLGYNEKPKIIYKFSEDIITIIKMLKKWRAYNNRILEQIKIKKEYNSQN